MTVTKVSRRGFAAGLAALLAMPAPLLARGGEPAASAKDFVEKIYNSYVGSPIKGANGVQLENAADIKRYFTPALAILILEDEAAAGQRHEPPALDGDAFIRHRDWDIADMSVDVKEAGAKATATVSFTNFGKAEKVVLELLKVGPNWRIADIQWDDAGTLRGLFRKK
jgi:Protein of unknown function (DUF3828)